MQYVRPKPEQPLAHKYLEKQRDDHRRNDGRNEKHDLHYARRRHFFINDKGKNQADRQTDKPCQVINHTGQKILTQTRFPGKQIFYEIYKVRKDLFPAVKYLRLCCRIEKLEREQDGIDIAVYEEDHPLNQHKRQNADAEDVRLFGRGEHLVLIFLYGRLLLAADPDGESLLRTCL